MLQGLSGLLIALVLTALLAYQAVRAAPGSRLRQAYSLASAGFGIIITLNLLYLIGAGNPIIANSVGLTAVALLIGAVAAFVTAIFNGEFQAKIRQAEAYTAGERERIAQRRAASEADAQRLRERATAAPPDQPAGGDGSQGR